MFSKIISSPLGDIRVVSDGENILRIDFIEVNGIERSFEDSLEKDLPIFQESEEFLHLYFSGKEGKKPKIKLEGTIFQKRIWELLLKIPFGECRSYGDLSKEYCLKFGVENMSSQAVGTAVGKNPLSILVPCHRIIKSDGTLGGFSSGLDRKKFLVEHEKIIIK